VLLVVRRRVTALIHNPRSPVRDPLASIALAVMDTLDILPALATEERFCLLLKKRIKTGVSDLFEIANETDTVGRSVPFVDVLQMLAGKIRTFKAKRYLAFGKQTTLFFDVGTVLRTNPTTGTVRDLSSFLGDPMNICQIGATDTAVHPAGCDLLRCKYACCQYIVLSVLLHTRKSMTDDIRMVWFAA
jgi:hypothetical protein